MRTRTSLICLLLCSSQLALATEYTFFLGGADVGKNTADWSADGTSFSSSTNFRAGATEISSNVSATYKNGKFVGVSYFLKSGKQELSLFVKDGVLGSLPPSPPISKKLTQTQSFLSNYHPLLLLNQLKTVTESKGTYESFFLDGVSELKYEAQIIGYKNLLIQNKPVRSRVVEAKMGAVVIQYWLDASTLNLLAMNVPAQKYMVLAPGVLPSSFDPMTSHPELSQLSPKAPAISRGINIEMRDKLNLRADIFRPSDQGKFPVILSRTPYGRDAISTSLSASEWAKRGYVFVVQDVRGTGDSAGIWNPFMSERIDGYDTIDWISKQSWCDGNIGMIGASYGGFVQWSAAVENHPALKTIIPQVSPPDMMKNIPYENGMFMLGPNLWWANIVGKGKSDLTKASQPFAGNPSINNFELSKMDDDLLNQDLPYWNEWVVPGATSKRFENANFQHLIKNVKIPTLNISGVWDGDGIGTNTNWELLRQSKNQNSWLIYGPWVHAFNTSSTLGTTNYGSTAIVDLDQLYLRWFDTWLKKKDVGLQTIPKAIVFETGTNQWCGMGDYPSSQMTSSSLFLVGGAMPEARSLSATASSKVPSTTYDYDPKSYQVKNFSEATVNEPDIWNAKTYDGPEIIFTGKPLTKPTLISAPIEAEIYFSTTANDADLYFQVVEKQISGRMQVIGQPGKMRLSYLNGLDKQVALTPGKIVKATLRHWDFTHMFSKDSQICVIVGSNLFPSFDRNLGFIRTPNQPAEPIKATHTLYHSAKYPSRIKFMTSSKTLPAYTWP